MSEPTEPPSPPTFAKATAGKPAVKKYSSVDYFFQFVTITAGVLIALLINGLVEWNNKRELVAQARATINQEITDNKKDLDVTLEGMARDTAQIDQGIQLANDILAKRPITIHQLNFNINLADLSMSGWRTAERTGALSHMEYGEVQRLSLLYDLQDLVVSQQRTLVGQLAEAMAILSGGFEPDRADFDDVELFRERLMRLRSTLNIHRDLATRLAERYAKALQP